MTSYCHGKLWKHVAVGACFLVSNSIAISQEPERPAWLDELSPLIPGQHAAIEPVVATFRLSWNNVLNAGSMFIAIQKTNPETGVLKGTAAGRSAGVARALWPYDFATTADTEIDSLLPLSFSFDETQRKERTLFTAEFNRRLDKIVTDTTYYHTEDGKLAETPEIKRRIYKFTEAMDMLSTVLFVRSLDLPDDKVIKTVVFPMNRPYLATMTVTGREKRKFKGSAFDTIRIDISINKINRDLTLKNYDKIRKATLWLTDDEFRLPLELQSEIFIGFVSARSTGFDWMAAGETPEQAVARVRKIGLAPAKTLPKTTKKKGFSLYKK